MSAFEPNPSYPRPTEPFYSWLNRANPALMSRVNALPQSTLEAFILGGLVARESIFFEERKDKSYRRIARTLAGKGAFDLADYLLPRVGVEAAPEDDRADAIADRLIEDLKADGVIPRDDDAPPHEDEDAPHEGTCADDCDGECTCYREGYANGLNDALSGDGPEDAA